MRGRSFMRSLCFLSFLLLFSCAFFVQSSLPQEALLDKEKSELVKDLESLGQGIEITRGCVERATTDAELRQCREEERIRQYYEVLDKLNEIGLTIEERRIKRLERRR